MCIVTKYHTTLDLLTLIKGSLYRDRKNKMIQIRKVEHVAPFVSNRLLWLITVLLDTGQLSQGNRERSHSSSQMNQTETLGER